MHFRSPKPFKNQYKIYDFWGLRDHFSALGGANGPPQAPKVYQKRDPNATHKKRHEKMDQERPKIEIVNVWRALGDHFGSILGSFWSLLASKIDAKIDT